MRRHSLAVGTGSRVRAAAPGKPRPVRRARLHVEALESRYAPAMGAPGLPTAAVAGPVAPVPQAGAGLVVNLDGPASLPAVLQAARALGADLMPLGVGHWYKVSGADGLAPVLRGLPGVHYLGSPTTLRVALAPNDPRFPGQWDLTGPYGVNAPAAWDVTTGSTAVTVAVIDTGVDYTHPDLYLNIWLNQAEIPESWSSKSSSEDTSYDRLVTRADVADADADGRITFRDLNAPANAGLVWDNNLNGRIDAGDLLRPLVQGGWEDGLSQDGDTAHVDDLVGWNFVANTNKPFDDYGHGTHVAGTIGAAGNDGTGVAGLNWQAQLMPLKFIAANGNGSDADAASAIAYASAHGARVSNNSYGGTDPSPVIRDAVAAVPGQLFVVAAGNDGRDIGVSPTYPAAYHLSNMVVVAATDSAGNLATFSNFSAGLVDLAAPGVGILSTYPGGYATLNGTSMATPHVAGVAALVLGRDPTLTVAQVKTQILASARPLASLAGKTVTGDLLDAARAVRLTNLSWAAGGLSGTPASADATTPFTVTRAFTVLSDAAPADFTIAYYASTDGNPNNPNNLLLALETVTGADKSPGPHTGASPLLRVGRPGPQYILAVLDAAGAVAEINEGDNVTASGAINFTGAADLVLDNGTAAYSETGLWGDTSGAVYGGTLRYASPASAIGQSTATWQAGGLPAGGYAVQATWSAYTNRASNAPYRVYDRSTLVATFYANQRVSPSGPVVGGVAFQALGTVTISSGPLKVVLGNDADGIVIADAVRLVTATPPNLSWPAGGLSSPPAALDTQTSFTVNRAYTVSGAALPSAFSIAYYASVDQVLSADDLVLGSETLASSGDWTVGQHAGTSPALRISRVGVQYVLAVLDAGQAIAETNEADNTALADQAVTVTGALDVVLDNGTPAYSETGLWGDTSGAVYGGTLRYASPASAIGPSTAAWQVSGLPAGSYAVQATWSAFTNRASNAPYRVYDGNTLVGTFYANQRVSPSGPVVGGVAFQALGTVTANSGTLRVVLGNDANGLVIADAVRLVGTATTPVNLSWPAGGLSSPPASLDTQTSFTVNRTYAVSGGALPSAFSIAYYASVDQALSADDLLLGSETLGSSGDLSVGAHAGTSPALRLSRVGVQYILAVLDAAGAVAETNEADNGTASAGAVTVTGVTDLVLDNGTAAYSETGIWGGASGYGYGGSLRYASAASALGQSNATWQAAGLAAGDYAVQATWIAYTNRASNAPYRVYDGNTLVATFYANQQAGPTGILVGGYAFQTLGTVPISSGTVRVVLGNDANGLVIADAVHLVPVAPPNLSTGTALDNGTAAYSETGVWGDSSGAVYGGTLRYTSPASFIGPSTATWQATGLAAGEYVVQATWSAFTNRASNAPYRVYDGNTLVAVFYVNQRLAPGGTLAGGVAFQTLGRVRITSGTLRVVLGNDADGIVIADAVRFIPL